MKTYTLLGSDSVHLILTSVLLFGQDRIVEDGKFGFSPGFKAFEVLVWKGLLVRQAWTLGAELSFYLVVPLILRDRKRWLFCLAASLLLRVYFAAIGLGTTDPSTYRFFPLEMALFLLGVFAHQFIKPALDATGLTEYGFYVKVVTFIFIPLILFFHELQIDRLLKSMLLTGGFVIALPLLAAFQRAHSLDNWIGALSYPIYICHWVVIDIVRFLALEGHVPDNGITFSAIVLITTLFLS